ncbi:LysR family transcriptional regulator [Terrihabitans sp. B22-R8]|uniref:LysR family transcriptional regulator n=1 Tax=Terrihabitans sp. B22-R8 TaxID=3425128 RepID=UPI00403C128D
MDIVVWRNFLSIIEAGSIRRAADNLHIAQSALTRQIAGLEREVGAPLLLRLPRGVRPTEAGLIAARRARMALDQFESVGEDIRALNGLQTGRISIAAIEPVAAIMLPHCITGFHAQYPGVSFDVRVGNTRQVLSLLAEGIADLALAYNAPVNPDISVRAHIHMPLVALVRNGHPIGDKTAIEIQDLTNWPIVLPPAGSPSRVLIDEAARREDCHFGSVLLESDSAVLRLSILENTDAIAILAEASGHIPGAGQSVAVLPIKHPMLEAGSLQLLANRNVGQGLGMSRASLAFERLLRAEMRKLRAAMNSSPSVR